MNPHAEAYEKIEAEQLLVLNKWQKMPMDKYELNSTTKVGHVFPPLLRYRFETMARLLDAAAKFEAADGMTKQTAIDLGHIDEARTTLLYAVSTGDEDAVLAVLAPAESSFGMYRKNNTWPMTIEAEPVIPDDIDDDDADDADDAPAGLGLFRNPAMTFAMGVMLTLVGQRVMK